MATYKVLQDIEAEDTLVGPLTLRQCIYAAIGILSAYLMFALIAKHAGFLSVIFLPSLIFGFFFAFPWSKQQPTEVWALAKIRFYLKPRRRIWDQTGVKQLVTITAPKRVQKAYVRNLSAREVQNRLNALANTIDSRGWAVKNIDLGYYTNEEMSSDRSLSDRLLDGSIYPLEVTDDTTVAADDIFDTNNNAVARKFDVMMAKAAGDHRQQLVDRINNPVPQQSIANSYWHMRTVQPITDMGQASSGAQEPYDLTLPSPVGPSDIGQTSRPTPPPATSDMGQTDTTQITTNQASQTVTDQADPAILELANNNDLNVATLAREAQARKGDSPDEVVVSLH